MAEEDNRDKSHLGNLGRLPFPSRTFRGFTACQALGATKDSDVLAAPGEIGRHTSKGDKRRRLDTGLMG